MIDTAGTEDSVGQAVRYVKKGATIVMVGYSKSGVIKVPMTLAMDKELTFKTVFRYRNIYPKAIEAVAAGSVNLKEIVSDVFDFCDILLAMISSLENNASMVKGVVRISGT